MGHQVTIWSEIPRRTRCDLSHQAKVVCMYSYTSVTNGSDIYIWASPEGISKLHDKVAQMPLSTLLLHCLLSPILHLWPHGEFLVINWQRKNFSGLVYKQFCTICKYQLKINSCSTFWDIPKENPLSGQSFKQCTWLLILLAKRIGQMCNYIPINRL